MSQKKYSLELVERLAANRTITSIVVEFDKDYYKSSVHIKKPHTYRWEDRDKIRWDHVTRCRLDFEQSKWYNIDGDGCERPGFRINPE